MNLLYFALLGYGALSAMAKPTSGSSFSANTNVQERALYPGPDAAEEVGGRDVPYYIGQSCINTNVSFPRT
jgi:hypothetical protein